MKKKDGLFIIIKGATIFFGIKLSANKFNWFTNNDDDEGEEKEEEFDLIFSFSSFISLVLFILKRDLGKIYFWNSGLISLISLIIELSSFSSSFFSKFS